MSDAINQSGGQHSENREGNIPQNNIRKKLPV